MKIVFFRPYKGLLLSLGKEIRPDFLRLFFLDYHLSGDLLNSSLYNKVESGEMPKEGRKLTEEEKLSIFFWILNGAQDN